MHTLVVQIHTGHPRLTAALGFPIAGTRGNLFKAQHCQGEGRVKRGAGPPSRTPSDRSRCVPTHQSHRGGTAGRWRDGSSVHCRNYGGKSCKLCLGCGCITQRQTRLRGEWGKRGIRRQGVHPCLCCSLHATEPLLGLFVTILSSWLHSATSSNLK